MNVVEFLLDVHVAPSLAKAIRQKAPRAKFYFLGKDPAPARDASDEELLIFAEARKISIITLDKSTMPGHWAEHLKVGRHSYGLFVLKQGYGRKRYVDDLLTVWAASEPEDWLDRLDYLPWPGN